MGPRNGVLTFTLEQHSKREVIVAQSAPPLNLPWTLSGGRGIFGLDPIHGALLAWATLMGFTLLLVILAAMLTRWQWGRLNKREAKQAAADRARHALSPADRARLRAEAGDLIRQAAVTAAAAKQAQKAAADTLRTRDVAREARVAAQAAYEAAHRAYQEAVAEAAKRANHEKQDGDELQALEVELHRTADNRAKRLFESAVAAERAAVTAAHVARVAAKALAEESVDIADDATLMRERLTAAYRVRGKPSAKPRQLTPRPVPAQRDRNREVSRA
jgi:hypothetical protein